MRYIFDNCLSFRLANMLAVMEVDVVPLRDLVDESIADIDFFQQLDGTRDVWVTYDHKQRTRVDEARALKEAGVTALWLGPFWHNKFGWDQAKWIVARWERIDSFASNVVPGTCAEIKENGRALVFHL